MSDPLRTVPTLRRALAGAAVLALVAALLVSRIEWRAAGGDPGAMIDGADGFDRADVVDVVDGVDGVDAAGDLEPRDLRAAAFSQREVLGSVAEVVVREGDTAVVNFVVPSGAIVRGVVLLGERPLPGAVVYHRPFLQGLCQQAWSILCATAPDTVITGSDGRFTQSVPYGRELAFWAVAPDGSRSAETRLTLNTGTTFDVELAVSKRRP